MEFINNGVSGIGMVNADLILSKDYHQGDPCNFCIIRVATHGKGYEKQADGSFQPYDKVVKYAITCFGDVAQKAYATIQKGSFIAFEGRLSMRPNQSTQKPELAVTATDVTDLYAEYGIIDQLLKIDAEAKQQAQNQARQMARQMQQQYGMQQPVAQMQPMMQQQYGMQQPVAQMQPMMQQQYGMQQPVAQVQPMMQQDVPVMQVVGGPLAPTLPTVPQEVQARMEEGNTSRKFSPASFFGKK